MSHNILITGASGYLGGTLLARWSSAKLPAYQSLYALVRTKEQAESVKQYGAEALTFDVKDEASTTAAIIDHKVTIVYFLVDAMAGDSLVYIIKALAEVKKQTGQEGLDANNTVIELAEARGIRNYIFIPCIVYGQGEGFGNPISIQTVAIVRAAKKTGRVYSPHTNNPKWPVCHVIDNSTLYLEILRNILAGKDIGHGRNGYYLAASGSMAWNDIYGAMAKGLVKRQIVDTESVQVADDAALQQMGEALGCPKEMVPLFLGGECTLEARHGHEIGWKPQYSPEHILEAADAEVDLIIRHL
ncbi:hypothetical protein N7474_004746 [Penicillium riverlandense]|uniref:uncharacterized protein n=1 Tax=Penicillium riverlandense TaxID=1903569 RepID=UPI0025491BDC|nr:uncharacterized protein N7474_004746 [Penicillium riverlandense]KAJ5819155.1 hypothetical protein N7474_004746 [Penicillium riverlandense]